MLKPVALGVAALVLCFCVGSAGASALASASLEITSFVWYIDSDYTENVDQVVTAALSPVTSENTILRDSDDSVDNSARLSVGNSESSGGNIRNRRLDDLGSPLDLPRVCLGADCEAAPPAGDFDPISPSVSGQFANSDIALNGFYADVPGVTTADAAVGVRADLSLSADDPDISSSGVATANWDADAYFISNGNFDTYFEVQFVAQALAQLSPDGQNSSARAFVDFSIQVGSNWIWFPQPVSLSARTLTPGETEQQSVQGTLYSYDSTFGMLSLIQGEEYRVQVAASTRVIGTANSPPVGEVPAPPIVWLMLAGLVGLMFGRMRCRLDSWR
jgi:hypothetical protein